MCIVRSNFGCFAYRSILRLWLETAAHIDCCSSYSCKHKLRFCSCCCQILPSHWISITLFTPLAMVSSFLPHPFSCCSCSSFGSHSPYECRKYQQQWERQRKTCIYLSGSHGIYINIQSQCNRCVEHNMFSRTFIYSTHEFHVLEFRSFRRTFRINPSARAISITR